MADPYLVLAEAQRVLRPAGGWSSPKPDWYTLAIDHPGISIAQAYPRYVTERVIRNTAIGRQLPRLATAAGFTVPAVLSVTATSGDGVLVNTSSVAGFWATAGPGAPPITAYSTSEFAIKGFSEALIEDLRANAPQVRVVVVMPGVVNTDIAENSRRALGLPEWEQLSDAQLLEQIPDAGRAVLVVTGLLAEDSPPMICARRSRD